MLFHTKGLYSGNSFKNIHNVLIKKGFIPKGFMNLYMLGMDLLTYAIKENTFLERLGLNIHSRNITKKVNIFIAKMENDRNIKHVYSKWYTFFDNMIVKPLEIKADNDHKDWIKGFNVNNDYCIKCMKCIDGCPRENINYLDKIEFGDICDVCLFCINNCPKHAINIFKKTIGKVKCSEERIYNILRGK
jgi:ferredoxin